MEKIMIPPLDSNAAEVIKNNWAKMDKPLHSLGKMEEMVEKYDVVEYSLMKTFDVRRSWNCQIWRKRISAGSNYADDKRLHERNCRR